MVSKTAVTPHEDAEKRRRRVTILGATGSIGASTLGVIADRPEAFEVEAVTANANAARLAAVAIGAGARLAVIADEGSYQSLKEALAGTGIAAAAGPQALIEAAMRPVDLVVAAIVGSAGLSPTFAAIESGTRVALANKECLVCAGHLFMAAAERRGVPILPIDSEHNAIFQILDGRGHVAIDRIVVTASGGPFRTWTREQMAAATPAQAMRHPTWTMGPKITVDSATLMNKGLELIEAHHLFDMPADKLHVLCHPQSIVHGLVEFSDGSVMAGLAPPDMRTPIAHCLAWPDRLPASGRRLDLAKTGSLTFEEPDLARFPALGLAREALEAGGIAPNILNAANEEAVKAFIAGKLGFLRIAEVVERAVDRAVALLPSRSPATVAEATETDREGRRIARELITEGGQEIPAE